MEKIWFFSRLGNYCIIYDRTNFSSLFEMLLLFCMKYAFIEGKDFGKTK